MTWFDGVMPLWKTGVMLEKYMYKTVPIINNCLHYDNDHSNFANVGNRRSQHCLVLKIVCVPKLCFIFVFSVCCEGHWFLPSFWDANGSAPQKFSWERAFDCWFWTRLAHSFVRYAIQDLRDIVMERKFIE